MYHIHAYVPQRSSRKTGERGNRHCALYGQLSRERRSSCDKHPSCEFGSAIFPNVVCLIVLQDLPDVTEEAWTRMLPRTKLGPHRRHQFPLEGVEGAVYTHVRVTIHPDGGIKRVRVFGKRANANEGEITSTDTPGTLNVPSAKPLVNGIHSEVSALGTRKTIPAVILTPEAFAPYGDVIQAYNTPDAAPLGTKVTVANQGSAIKYHALGLVKSCYPVDLGAKTALSVYRANPIDANVGELFDVKLLERHPCTNQAFFALGAGTGVGEYVLEKQGRAYLVVVALNGEGKFCRQ